MGGDGNGFDIVLECLPVSGGVALRKNKFEPLGTVKKNAFASFGISPPTLPYGSALLPSLKRKLVEFIIPA